MLVRVWQYDVVPGAEAAFEQEYGRDGSWARLFAAEPGYLDTELFRSVAVPGRYLTVDRFSDAGAWRRFLVRHRAAYDALDARCARLTAAEVELAGGGPPAAGQPPGDGP
jgi:heme-degrading monooxygenase HmoA